MENVRPVLAGMVLDREGTVRTQCGEEGEGSPDGCSREVVPRTREV